MGERYAYTGHGFKFLGIKGEVNETRVCDSVEFCGFCESAGSGREGEAEAWFVDTILVRL